LSRTTHFMVSSKNRRGPQTMLCCDVYISNIIFIRVAFKLKTKIVYIITFVLILSDNKQTGIQLLCPGPLYLLKYYICVRRSIYYYVQIVTWRPSRADPAQQKPYILLWQRNIIVRGVQTWIYVMTFIFFLVRNDISIFAITRLARQTFFTRFL